MTDRLYYRDSGLRQFDAMVVSTAPAERNGSDAESAGWWVVLDRTAFYPTSGGQPYDTGFLGEAPVTDVFEDSDGRIVHVTDRRLPVGPVRGSIEFGRRFDHMQQHTGSHLVSVAFLKLYGIPSISFHLGHEVSTIDLATPTISQEQLRAAERMCNEIIRENLPVTAEIEPSMTLAETEPDHPQPPGRVLRFVEIQGWDRQPCGGTHVDTTGQIGLILLRKLVKTKRNYRLEFVCGARAAKVAQHDFAVMQEAARHLSCTFAGLPAAISNVVAERDACLGAYDRLREETAILQADLLLARRVQEREKPDSPVVYVFENRDLQYLKLVALCLIKNPGIVVLLGSRANGAVVFAQAAGLPTDMNTLFRSMVLSAGGKGGGTRDLAQGAISDPKNMNILLTQACEVLGQNPPPVVPKLQRARPLRFGKLTLTSSLGD